MTRTFIAAALATSALGLAGAASGQDADPGPAPQAEGEERARDKSYGPDMTEGRREAVRERAATAAARAEARETEGRARWLTREEREALIEARRAQHRQNAAETELRAGEGASAEARAEALQARDARLEERRALAKERRAQRESSVAEARASLPPKIDSEAAVSDRREHPHGVQALIDGERWVWVPNGSRLTADGSVVPQGGPD